MQRLARFSNVIDDDPINKEKEKKRGSICDSAACAVYIDINIDNCSSVDGV